MQILETVSGYILQFELFSWTPEATDAIVCEELQLLLNLMAIQSQNYGKYGYKFQIKSVTRPQKHFKTVNPLEPAAVNLIMVPWFLTHTSLVPW